MQCVFFQLGPGPAELTVTTSHKASDFEKNNAFCFVPLRSSLIPTPHKKKERKAKAGKATRPAQSWRSGRPVIGTWPPFAGRALRVWPAPGPPPACDMAG